MNNDQNEVSPMKKQLVFWRVLSAALALMLAAQSYNILTRSI